MTPGGAAEIESTHQNLDFALLNTSTRVNGIRHLSAHDAVQL